MELRALTLLVGRNGSGKSNFLDALRFIVDGLRASLDHAVKTRGGIEDVLRRSARRRHGFAIELSLDLSEVRCNATYGFEIVSQRKGGYVVKSERSELRGPGVGVIASFHVSEGNLVECSQSNMPPAARDRLYLVTASALPEFRLVYDSLLAMGFYNLDPQQMREVQSPDAGELLRHDGSNIASVVGRIAEERPDLKQRIGEYLASVVPDIIDFRRKPLAHRETLEFLQKVDGYEQPWQFYSSSMSDGTLRCLGILVAVMQFVDSQNRVRLVGIEEPETALHPAAAGALMDSLREAAADTQVLVSTQSPDLLDEFVPEKDCLLVVQMHRGTTVIGPADPPSLEAIRSHLYTPGELLRMDQLQPNRDAVEGQTEVAVD